MVNLKNCLTAGVLLYGAVFALYGNHWIDPHGVSVYGQEADFSHYPITRGGSVGFSATEGSAGYASDRYSAQEYAKSLKTTPTGGPGSFQSGMVSQGY